MTPCRKILPVYSAVSGISAIVLPSLSLYIYGMMIAQPYIGEAYHNERASFVNN